MCIAKHTAKSGPNFIPTARLISHALNILAGTTWPCVSENRTQQREDLPCVVRGNTAKGGFAVCLREPHTANHVFALAPSFLSSDMLALFIIFVKSSSMFIYFTYL